MPTGLLPSLQSPDVTKLILSGTCQSVPFFWIWKATSLLNKQGIWDFAPDVRSLHPR
ncbi:MAG: hypothetical protein HC780_11800 [Leptolyngbyaceae cyanobacterium CSU_1_3]|nr:hypothetical protein [Leptolyngbyaceae cyanobacterium CSU_1_3]